MDMPERGARESAPRSRRHSTEPVDAARFQTVEARDFALSSRSRLLIFRADPPRFHPTPCPFPSIPPCDRRLSRGLVACRRPAGMFEAMSTPPEGRITIEARGHLLLIGLDRPDKRNAFGPEMLRGLAAAYAQLEETAYLRCGVLFAHGDHFTGGLDLAAVGPLVARGERLTTGGAVDPWGIDGPLVSKPVVVAVRGMCLTLGIELILAADICIAASDARFAQIEVKRGIFPFGGATIRMPQRVGWGNAMRYLLTGDEFDAATALSLGLVQEVVQPGEELERAVAIAERIAKQAPLAVQAVLASARTAEREGTAAATTSMRPTLERLLTSEDAREGMISFIERREARFAGK